MDPEPTKKYVDEQADVVNSILLWRIYDALLVLISQNDPQASLNLARMHENGDFIGPNPAYRPDDPAGAAG